MTTARDEIFGQHMSLRQTCAYMQGQSEAIKDFYGISGFYSVTFTGCGPVYALCDSAELSLRMRGGMTAMSMSAGDLILNMPRYLDMLNGSMILAASRTGKETELVYALEKAHREAGATIIACSTDEHTEVSQIADIQLELPWARDESPYLTRSIGSLYLVNLYNLGLLSGDVTLIDEIKASTDGIESFISNNTAAIQKVAEDSSWERVVILADGELLGLAHAGAEIVRSMAGVPAWYSNVLDSRYVFGPAFINDKTLVIAVVSPEEDVHQNLFLRELRATGAKIVTLGRQTDQPAGTLLNIALPPVRSIANWGYNFLFTVQALAYFRAGI
ncbi:MAG: hypothetical protein FWG93_02820 [Oscillospiraceae bacterium]|nr:hypothetical protein [Oscillospiraceae bacterium]